VVTHPTEGETNCVIDLLGYGSRANILTRDNVYFTCGRLLKNPNGSYHLFYEPHFALAVGRSDTYVDERRHSRFLGKVIAFGFGSIISTQRKAGVGPNGGQQEDLEVVMRHHDWNSAVRL
jgi:hypothetical protein